MTKFNRLAFLAFTASTLAYGTAFAAGVDAKIDVNTKPASVSAATKTAGQAVDGEVSALTNDFVKNASIGSEFEIQLSKLALDESENADVREFAKQMIEDHTKNREMLKASLPADINPMLASNQLDEKHEAIIERLDDLEDEKFDAAYIAEQKKAHAQTIALFDKYARKGDEKSLKDFAKASLPTLKAHQQHAATLKAGPSTASRDDKRAN